MLRARGQAARGLRLRIKSLQINGFKSFVDKTSFAFQPGITAIVGPNGCGKSNVVDAIRWAMGEQAPRRLRGKGMEDVIFAGSDARAPVGLAEVVLTFDNADGVAPPEYAEYSEIQVSRRLYRDGESEYLINKTPVRLRDVLDFFRDTGIGTKGYTIVEQGRIAEIVSAKPEERRSLIEEAAGISKYKARRVEAERKLEATEQNLVRVRDVLGEIRRQISSIERQAKKAARYKRLREIQRVLELSLASEERAALTAELEAAGARLTALRDAAAAAEARLAEREAALEGRRLDLAERERLVVEGNELLFQLRSRIKELESQIAYERRERASLAEVNEARAAEREQLQGALRQAEAQEQELATELSVLEAALADEGAATARAEAEARAADESLRQLERERESDNQALVEVLTRVARSEDRLAALAERATEIDRRLRNADEAIEVQQNEVARVSGEERDLEEGLRNLLAERDRLMGLLRDALAKHERTVAESRRAGEELRGRRELRETRRARLASLRELLDRREDISEAARFLTGLPDDARRALGLVGLVREAFEVEPAVERAVEALLAERAEGLVSATPDGALEALAELRRAGAGRGVLVLDRGAASEPQGFVPLGTPLLAAVRPQPGFEGVAQALLGGVNLVERLSEALEVYGRGRIPCTFVTPQGDVLTPDGVIRGGGESERAGVLTRVREVRELEGEVEALDREVSVLETVARQAESELVRASDELENLRNRHHTAALAVASHEKDLERSRERVKALGEAQEARGAERSQHLAEFESLAGERDRLEALLAAGREERLQRQSALDALGLRIASAARERSRLEAAATERRVHQASRGESVQRARTGLERVRAQNLETREWIRRREAEIQTAEARREELARTLAEAELALAARLREEEAARLASEEKRDAWETLAAQVREQEAGAREVRIELEAGRDEARQAELGLRELELRRNHLESSVRERWNVDLATWKPPVFALEPLEPGADGSVEIAAFDGGEDDAVQPAEGAEGAPAEGPEARDARREAREIAALLAQDLEARRAQLDEVRQRLEALGDVNLGAIEEHEELRERFRFLEEQRADLESSLTQLREAIGKINRTSRKRFRETFDAVNERFQKNFPRLFRGGKAWLTLTETEDVLEAGIEITAQPPGKRLQSVNLLSGGEKTMTAISLLVSVFQVRPSPFFLLDEVDAALDDANVGRFNEIVREMSAESQFLLITHNKRTIEVAAKLYGVTMEERGVSKLVAVELHGAA
jgi:chromosome segregation protein